ncbi:MAG: sigma-70 family RNA polymerase sigma factor [Planctomycetes bacterium]|nr:sigma-70 family RNA polymerase sigma factor [Planctomycetota bacterium]
MTTGDDRSAPEPVGSARFEDAAADAMRRFQRSGDRAELERALLLSAPALRRAAVRLVGAHAADDLLQECFVVAITRATTFAPDLRLLPWLLGILHNLFRNHRRRRWSLGRWTSPGERAVRPDPDLLAADEPPPATVVDHREWHRRIIAVAEELEEPYRSVVLEHLCNETPLVQLAGRLNRRPGTVRSQLHRGLEELRRRLPTPLLGALAVLLAGRRVRAMAATNASSPGRAPQRPSVAWFGLAAIVAVSISLWSRSDTGVPASPPTAAAAVAKPLATGSTAEVTASTAADRRTVVAATRRLSARFRLPNGAPADDLTVWCDPDFVAGRPVPSVHTGWRQERTDADGLVGFDVPTDTAVALRLHELDPLQVLPPNSRDTDWEFAVSRGARVRFQCVDGEGRPVAFPTLFACGSNGVRSPMLPVARGDAHGFGTTRTSLGRTHLFATAPGHQISERVMVDGSNRPEGIVTARFALSPSQRTVRGRVVDEHGSPLNGAVVAAWVRGSTRSAPIYLQTDAAGDFATEHLPPGVWIAAAIAPGHAMAVRQCEEHESVCDLVLCRGVDVVGNVAFTPATHFERLRIVTRELEGIPDNPLGALGAVVAADGGFVLRNVHAGRFLVGVGERGGTPFATERIEVTGEAPPPLHFTVAATASWQVRVLDPLGHPISDCLVRSYGAVAMVGHLGPEHAVTDAAGRCLLRRHSVPRRIAVHLKLGSTHEVFPIHCIESAGPSEPGKEFCVTIEPGLPRASLHGRIPEQLRVRPDGGGLRLRRVGDDLPITTDPDGTFRVDNLPPGTDWHLIWQRSDPSVCRLDLAVFDLAPGATKDFGELPCAGVGSLALRLAADGGGACMHVSVVDTREYTLLFTTVRRGADFRCQLPVGRYRLDYTGSDGSRCSRSFELKPDAITALELQAGDGLPCRLFVPEAESRTNHLALVVSVEDATATGTVVPHPMLANFDPVSRGWCLDIDLRPGTYQVIAEGGDGDRRGGTIVVGPRQGLQTFPLAPL